MENYNLDLLKGKKLLVVGYGAQGKGHAVNLKKQGLDVCVALHKGSKSVQRAQEDGFEVLTLGESSLEQFDVCMLLVPDENHKEVYNNYLHEGLKEGAYVGVAHAFNVYYGQMVPRSDLNVFLVAPKGPGSYVLQGFEEGCGLPALVAVWQDKSGDTKELAHAWGYAVCLDKGLYFTTFREEVETDLFGEQAILMGGVVELMRQGFNTLVENGYDEKMAYFECVHEMKMMVDLVYYRGFDGMRKVASNTAEYGDYITGPKVISEESKKGMQDTLDYIKNGGFAHEYLSDASLGFPKLNALRNWEQTEQVTKVGNEFRKEIFGDEK